MVQLDSRLPLLGIPADVPGSFQRGLEFRERRRQIGENRQISDLFQSQGPALSRGDPKALDALSRVDPQAAQGLAAGAQKISAGERQRELNEARRALALVQRADTPEKWDAIARKIAPDLVGQFARREELAETFGALVEALDPSTPDKPIFFKGQRGAVNQIIPDGKGGFEFRNIVPAGPPTGPSTVIKIGGFDFGSAPDGATPPASASATPTASDVSPSLGFEGTIKGAFNAAGDAFNLGLAFPLVAQGADDLRFLKVQTTVVFKALINQRLSNQLLDQFDKLTVSPGSPALGKGRGLIRLKNARDLIQSTISNLERVSGDPGSFAKKAVSDARIDGIALTSLLRDYNAIIASFGKGGEADPIDPEVEGFLREFGVIE